MNVTRLSCLITILLAATAALAHETKPYDRNGGHWDESGSYHCHLPGCIPTVSRWQFRHVGLSNKEDDLYYVEEDWPHFLPISGCKTSRTVVLQNTSKIPVTWTNPRQCEIREGLWVDPYTGKEYKRAAKLDIDLVIPPQYANAANGYMWDDNKRAQFANDVPHVTVGGIGRWAATKPAGSATGAYPTGVRRTTTTANMRRPGRTYRKSTIWIYSQPTKGA